MAPLKTLFVEYSVIWSVRGRRQLPSQVTHFTDSISGLSDSMNFYNKLKAMPDVRWVKRRRHTIEILEEHHNLPATK